MNTNTDNQGKERVLKTLAIGGFVGLIIIIAWLGIQLISFMPSAFTSLASLANSVYNYKPVELVVVTNKTTAVSGEAITVSWNEPARAGTFVFSYACTSGVSVEARSASGGIENIICDTTFPLGPATTLDISISSERNRFTEVPYTISFIAEKAKTPESTSEKTITVVNAMISPVEVAEATTTEPTIPTTPKPEVVVKPVPVVPKPTVPVAPKPVYVSKPIYGIPVSNSNGFTDIGVRSIGVGTVDNANRFTLVGTMPTNKKGAIQFEIKNFGTKTSDTFTYTALLPNGSEYKSPVQPALKPNERVIATIGFDTNGLSGIKTFSVTTTISGDRNLNNNTFNSAVRITN